MSDFLKNNIGTIGAGVGGLALGGVVGYAAARRRNKRKKSKRRSSGRSVRKRTTARKRHHYTSKRRIHRTKTGQPYIILASGKARFISKKSARISRKRKGGRY
jgi:hypothetical protein